MFLITLVGSQRLQRKRWRSLLGHRRWIERWQVLELQSSLRTASVNVCCLREVGQVHCRIFLINRSLASSRRRRGGSDDIWTGLVPGWDCIGMSYECVGTLTLSHRRRYGCF
jgi:hypothetical protein